MKQNGEAGGENNKINMPVFELFPGVQVIKVSVRTRGFVEKREKSNRLEINFCVGGRFECEFTKRDIAILKPGDMSVSMFDGKNGIKSYSGFPMGFYEGITIMADCDVATAWMKETLGLLAVDMNILKKTLLQDHWYWMGEAGLRCEHVLREIYGMPVYRYLKEYRMEQAAVDLINTDASVMEIALNAGFTNASKFSEGFRKRYGMTPTAYRKMQKCKIEME